MLLAEVDELYPQRLVPTLLELDRNVAPGAREPTLQLAGKRIGAWLAIRRPGSKTLGSLDDAIAHAGLPALSDLVTVDVQGSQLHLHESPLCTEPGHSGCAFFSGYGRETGPRWGAFVAALDALDTPAVRAEAPTAALETFETLEAWLLAEAVR